MIIDVEKEKIMVASRAQSMRLCSQERVARFLNSKQRTIGIDKDYLDEQVEEKNRLLLEEKRKESEEAQYQVELLEHLDKLEFIETESKIRKNLEYKHSILEQMNLAKNNALRNGGPLNIDHCGPASLQVFAGEDSKFDDRIKVQKQQILDWCSHQIDEKQESIMQEKEANKHYSEYVLAEDDIRRAVEEEKRNHDKEKAKAIQNENLEKAKMTDLIKRCTKENIDKIEENEIVKAQKSPFLSEDVRDDDDCRIRPDHFKGFSSVKIAQIYAENNELVSQKKKVQEEEKAMKREWENYQSEVTKKLEEDEINKQDRIREENYLQADFLRLQQQELKEKQSKMSNDQFGKIEKIFFQGFGTSCR